MSEGLESEDGWWPSLHHCRLLQPYPGEDEDNDDDDDDYHNNDDDDGNDDDDDDDAHDDHDYDVDGDQVIITAAIPLPQPKKVQESHFIRHIISSIEIELS